MKASQLLTVLGTMYDQSDQVVDYIILPPGHGKSYRHTDHMELKEADTIVGCKSTVELCHRRSVAKLDGNWEPYDTLWTDMIKEVMPKYDFILMVPDASVGAKFGGSCLFHGVLSDKQWAENLKNRKGTVEEYRPYKDKLLNAGAEEFKSNHDLDRAIDKVLRDWREARAL